MCVDRIKSTHDDRAPSSSHFDLAHDSGAAPCHDFEPPPRHLALSSRDLEQSDERYASSSDAFPRRDGPLR
jgi:hypothetical protein